jgi:hypothetical protein
MTATGILVGAAVGLALFFAVAAPALVCILAGLLTAVIASRL